MKIIEVSGAPLSMGKMQGEATSDDWVASIERLSAARVSDALQTDIAKYCPRQMDRLVGIAAGAAITVDSLLIALFSEVLLTQPDYFIGGCSAAAVRGKASLSGETIIARNYDFPAEGDLPFHLIARISRPDDAFNSVEITSGHLAGCHDGVNEKGLAISYNHAYALDKPARLVPISLLVQESLEKFEAVEQVVDYITSIPRASGALLMIADANGDVASLELSPHNHGIRRPDGERIAHTNHYHVPDMSALNIPGEALYSDKMPSALRGVSVGQSSGMRYERLAMLLGQATSFSEEGLIALMKDHGENGDASDDTICRHGAYFMTKCSVLLYPARRSLKAAFGPPCEADYESVSLV